MTLKSRFSLIAIGIVIFIIIAPALILYARGFKIDTKNWRFVKTGAIVIRTEPTKAQIFFDDKLQKNLTPATFRFLIPKDYNIKIQKNDYQPWIKRLAVKSQLVTWANFEREFITLFLQQPKLDQTIIAENLGISKNFQEISLFQNGQFNLLDVNSGKIKNLGLIKKEDFNLLFGSQKDSWQNGEQIYNNFYSIDTIRLSPKQLEKLDHIETNGRIYVLKIEDNLYSYSPAQEPLLIVKNISSFILENQFVWYLKGNSLFRIDLIDQNTEEIATEIPKPSRSKIIRTENDIFLVLDKTLYIVTENLEKISDNVIDAFWDSSYHQLLFANDNELYIYNPSTKKLDLIQRSIEKISNPILNQATGYVFYKTDNAIKAVEIDGRDHRNIYTIANVDPFRPCVFTLSENGKFLFIITDKEINVFQIR